MENFKQASKLKLRFNTSKGNFSVEQLWDLSLAALASLIKGLKKEIKKDNDDELSFLDDTTVVDPTVQLRYDIVKDIYLEKRAARDAIKEEAEKKANNQRILELIKKKQEEKLGDLSVEELEKLLK